MPRTYDPEFRRRGGGSRAGRSTGAGGRRRAGAERIVLVQDNLNTHTPASLYEAFAPAEAKRLVDRLELHYPPKHGSWLNMAEVELAVLAGQCLDRRLGRPGDA